MQAVNDVRVVSPVVPRVVVVGGGFGGLRVANQLAGTGLDVTLIDRRNHHLFQPLLYQVATAGLAVSDIAMPLRAVLRKANNVQVLLGEVVDVETDSKQVTLADGRMVPYDFAVVAAGAKTRMPGNDAAKQVFGLKTLEDARAIRQRILTCFEHAELEEDAERRAALTTFVVVGGGPTGVEMAGAIRELAKASAGLARARMSHEDVRVILVEVGDRVLRPFDPRLSEAAKAQLEELGVEVRTGSSLAFGDEPGCVRIGDDAVRHGALVWAGGVEPVPLAAVLGAAAEDGRVRVEADCSLDHAPDVFVIGDMAYCKPEGCAAPLPGVAPVAVQQGDHVARQIQRSLQGRPREPFRYNDRGMMATIGRSRAVAQRGRFKASGFSAWLAWLAVHLAVLVGFRNRLAVLVNWTWQYFTYRRGHRILLPSAGRLDAAPMGEPHGTARGSTETPTKDLAA